MRRSNGRGHARGGVSDQDIVAALSAEGSPSTLETLADDLRLSEPREQRALRRRLDALERHGLVVRNRRGEYGLARKMDLTVGRVHAHRDGYGFLVPEDGEGGDFYLAPREMRALLHGDRIVVRLVGIDERGRREGAVVEVLERANDQVVGRFWRESGVAYVRPDNQRIHQDVMIPSGREGRAAHGEMVVARIDEQPTKHHQPVGTVCEVLGDALAPGMTIDVALRAYQIPHEFPRAALTEAERFGTRVPARLRAGREDVRDLGLVTIDGIDAKDFDDAVHCVATPSGWKLTVAIADVASYVRPGSALDEEARRRGTSVYFPERVVPMLPEALSNGLCSLRPDEDRLCMVCELLVARDGAVRRSRFYQGVMRSHARLTYDEVAKVLVQRDARTRARLEALVPALETLHAAYRALRAAREARGALELDSSESRFVFGRDGKVEAIVPVVRNDAHSLIEECMIAANVAAARFLERHRLVSLYRVHEGPNPEKLADLRAMLTELGLKLRGGTDPSPHDYARLLEECRARPESPLVQMALLRSLKQANYASTNVGHFGLALQRYMHFTSPIRRYPDLVVHRAIKQALSGGRRTGYPYGGADLVALGEHTSMTERRAEDATRDVAHRLKCEYMLGRVGERFDGVVSGVVAFGVFVNLEDLDVAGLVHVSGLGHDYFHFDPVAHQFQGENTGVRYKVGDRLAVRVSRVDVEERKIDLELIDPPGGDGRRVARRNGRGGRGRGGRGGRRARR